MANKTETEFTFDNARGQKLHAVQVMPAGPPKAVLVWHHGLGEHIGRYQPMFRRMAEQGGVAVFSYDAHGHGKSEPQDKAQRALIWRFDDLLDDLAQFVGMVEQRLGASPPPLFLGGQSLGGLVVALAAARDPPPARVAGIILFAAALNVVWTPMLRVQAQLGGLIANLVPKARIVPAVQPADMHPDPRVVKEYVEDPLNTVGNVCSRTGNETLQAFHRLERSEGRVTLPVLAVHGTSDHCTSFDAVKAFCGRVASRDVTFRPVEGGYHELLMASPEREQLTDEVLAWMGAREAGPVAGAAATGAAAASAAAGAAKL